MKTNLKSFFYYSSGFVLALTALAKILSAFGKSRILLTPDPILGLYYKELFFGLGILEIFIALVCLFSWNAILKAILVAWLSTVFVFYRIGLYWGQYPRHCKCLGDLTDALHISPMVANILMDIVLIYLLFGSYVILLSNWWQNRCTSLLIVSTNNKSFL